MRVNEPKPQPQPQPHRHACIDRSRELLAGQIVALGLDPRCRYCVCSTGEHVAHRLCPPGKGRPQSASPTTDGNH